MILELLVLLLCVGPSLSFSLSSLSPASSKNMLRPSSFAGSLSRRVSLSPSLSPSLARPLSSTAGAVGEDSASSSSSSSAAVFTGYNVYKRKAALNVKVIPPSFRTTRASRTLSKEGVVLLEMAPANDVNNPTLGEYNWAQKITFAVDVNECGELLAMDRTRTVEFIHDPKMGGPEAGKVTKKVKFAPAPDGKGLYLSVAHTDRNKNLSNSLSLPVSWAEMEVMRSIIQYALPRLLGIDKVFEGYREASSGPAGSASAAQDRTIWD